MSLPNEMAGHGQMSCNPEAHDYAGFGNDRSLQPPVHDPRTIDAASEADALLKLPAETLQQRYEACVRNLSNEDIAQVEATQSSIAPLEPLKLQQARRLYLAWQIKCLPFISRRKRR